MASSTSTTSNHQDPHKIIAAFRVAELKQFLKSVRASTAGRKKDLQERAIKLVDTGNQKIIDTLVQINENMYPSTIVTLPAKNPPKPPQSHSTANPPSFHVKHPDVKLKSHAFYQHIDTVYRTTAMESPSYSKKAMTVQFHLTPQHVRHIFDSETTPSNYRTQVILRFCKNETSCPQEDYYPGACYVTINSQPCPIPGYNPSYSMRPDYKRQGKPINITTYIHTSPAIVNTLLITWNHDIIHSQGFCFAIDLMTCLSPADLLQKLKIKGTRSSSVSKAMIKDKLSMDRDAEISTTSLRITLICPLSKMRINNPCKSAQCDHLQCFDASTYLQMNERKPKWICPVCDRPAPFSDLLIDGYLLDICEKSRENLIEFNTEGIWHSVDSHKDKVVTLTPPTSITIMDSPRNDNSSNPKSSGADEMGVIDLTADSDDEHINIGPPNLNGCTNSSPPIDDGGGETHSHSGGETHSHSGGETRSRSSSESNSGENHTTVDSSSLQIQQILFDLFGDNSHLGGDQHLGGNEDSSSTTDSSCVSNTDDRGDNPFTLRTLKPTLSLSSFLPTSLVPSVPPIPVPRVPVISHAPHVPSDQRLMVHVPRSHLVSSTFVHPSSSREKVMLGKRSHSSSRENDTSEQRSHSSARERIASGKRSYSSSSREKVTSDQRSHSSSSREKFTTDQRSHSSSSREKVTSGKRSHSSSSRALGQRSHSSSKENGTLGKRSHSSSWKRSHHLGRTDEPMGRHRPTHIRFNDSSSSGDEDLDSLHHRQSRKGSSPKRSWHPNQSLYLNTPTRTHLDSPDGSDSSMDG